MSVFNYRKLKQEQLADKLAADREQVPHQGVARFRRLQKLARATELGPAQFLIVTAGEGEVGLFEVDDKGVRVPGGLSEALSNHPDYLLDEARALERAPELEFPCSPQALGDFLRDPVARLEFPAADDFLRALGATHVPPQILGSVTDEAQRLARSEIGKTGGRKSNEKNRAVKEAAIQEWLSNPERWECNRNAAAPDLAAKYHRSPATVRDWLKGL